VAKRSKCDATRFTDVAYRLGGVPFIVVGVLLAVLGSREGPLGCKNGKHQFRTKKNENETKRRTQKFSKSRFFFFFLLQLDSISTSWANCFCCRDSDRLLNTKEKYVGQLFFAGKKSFWWRHSFLGPKVLNSRFSEKSEKKSFSRNVKKSEKVKKKSFSRNDGSKINIPSREQKCWVSSDGDDGTVPRNLLFTKITQTLNSKSINK
jgi:hypothetical protein